MKRFGEILKPLLILIVVTLLAGCATIPERILQTASPNTKPPPLEAETVIVGPRAPLPVCSYAESGDGAATTAAVGDAAHRDGATDETQLEFAATAAATAIATATATADPPPDVLSLPTTSALRALPAVRSALDAYGARVEVLINGSVLAMASPPNA